MDKIMKGVNIYKNGNYTVMMFPDGTKVRRTPEDEFLPEFAENCDVKITDRCDGGCPFCYEGCTESGAHADFTKYDKLFDSLHPYTELALNGNDLTHPDLEKLLERLKEKRVYTNLTVNQKHFMKHYDLLLDWETRGLIYGLGVSLTNPSSDFIEKVQKFPNAVIHTIVGILTRDGYDALKDNGLKLLVLGYKDRSRGIEYKKFYNHLVEKNTKWLLKNIEGTFKHFNVVSFDNLALEQLNVKSLLSEEEWEEFYMGDDGGFTFYIDLVKGEFAKNSVSQERYDIGDKTVDEMFKFIQSKNIG